MVTPTVTIPFTFLSDVDAQGKRKKIVIEITDDTINEAITHANNMAVQLGSFDGRVYTASLPFNVFVSYSYLSKEPGKRTDGIRA